MTLLAPAETAKPSSALTGSTTSSPTVKVHRSRASIIATVALLLGVLAALTVLTGSLAGLGAVIGVLALIVGIIGMVRTKRSFVTGRGDAILGLVLGLAAAAVGALAVTGQLSWLDPSADNVARLHDWLGTHASWLTKTW